MSSNWWFLLVIATIAFLDSVFPVVPGETSVIIGGVAAGQGHYSIALVIAAGAIGAFLGDNLAYILGNKMSGFIERQASKREKWQFRLDWAAFKAAAGNCPHAHLVLDTTVGQEAPKRIFGGSYRP